MQKGIHPKIYTSCLVTCACGNSFTTVSTLPSIKVDICSNCHPFFTGQQKFVDTEGRIDKFNKKMAKASEKKATTTPKKPAKKQSGATAKSPTLKDLLKQQPTT